MDSERPRKALNATRVVLRWEDGPVTARRNGIPTLAQAVDLSLETLFAPPKDDWRSRSLCSELPVAEADRLFYPTRGQSTKAAKALCARCPVARECLEFALGDEYALAHGVWGATTARERRVLARGRAANVQHAEGKSVHERPTVSTQKAALSRENTRNRR
jgi:WhiB family transcriptional regulator, redox-sensing transcriptional regulator